MAFATYQQFCDGVLQSTLLDDAQRTEFADVQRQFTEARFLAQELLRRNWLTAYQVNQIFQGKPQGLVIGPYVLLERIGEGGMGQVFRARQRLLKRVVALKLIRKECIDNPRVIQRFQREIRAAGQLNHPHIVRAYDADQVQGTYFIAMEFIDGQDLAKLVKEQGPLPVDQACEYIRQAALGLQHAFERGLVHRDIKPANLLVARAVTSERHRSSGKLARPGDLTKISSAPLSRPDKGNSYPWGMVKILDLGLARCTDPFMPDGMTNLTQVGSIMGTPEFIAPEQARDSHTSDVRADLYSLGCTLYFLLTGQPPFPTGTVTEKLLQHQMDDPESLVRVRASRLFAWKKVVDDASLHVPPEVERVVRKLMAKRPDKRFQTPIELANELGDVLRLIAERPRCTNNDPPSGESTKELAVLPFQPSVGADHPTIMQPLLAQLATKARARRLRWMMPAALAATGVLFFLVVASVLAIVMSRGMQTQASQTPANKNAKQKPITEPPVWKKSLHRAVTNRATWDEARAEIGKERALSKNEPDRRRFDTLLLNLPTPFDELKRSKFDGILPPMAPAEIIGTFGPPKQTAWKPVTTLAVSPNGRWLVTNEDNAVRLFDLQGTLAPYRIPAHDNKVTSIAVANSGKYLVSASMDKTARVWDLATRNRIASFGLHKAALTHLAIHPNGNEVASAAKERTIRIWNPRSGEEIATIDSQMDEVTSLAFGDEGKTLFWVGASNQLRWTSLGDKKKSRFGTVDLDLGIPRVLAVRPTGDLVLVADDLGAYQAFRWNGNTLKSRGEVVKEHKQIGNIAFAPDGESFVTAGVGPTAIVWNATDLQVASRMPYVRNPSHSVMYSPEGRHLVLGGANNHVVVVRLSEPNLTLVKQAAE